MRYKVNYSLSAEQDLIGIFRWIADQGSPQTAERFVVAIADYCESLADSPLEEEAAMT